MIKIDYPATMRKVQILFELSDRLNRLSNDLNNMMNDTNDHWHGQAATAYLNQCENLRQAIIQTKSEMKIIAETIQNVADNIKRTDDNLAKMTISGGDVQ